MGVEIGVPGAELSVGRARSLFTYGRINQISRLVEDNGSQAFEL